MARSELRSKTIFFLIFAGVVGIVLILAQPIIDLVQPYVISEFGLQIVDDKVITLAGDEASKMAETTVGLALNVLRILKVILWMALIISLVRFVGYMIGRTANRNKTAEGDVSSLLTTVISIVVYIVAFFIVFQTQFPKIELTALFTGSTILGIVVGLALQDTLGNLFAGLALSADQPFAVGDVVQLPGRGEGVVEAISWRGVKIRTFQNKLLVVSNSVLGKELIEVAPKNNLNAKVVFFNTLYSNSPAHTIHAVREAVRQIENVSQKKRPVVRIRNLAADGIDYEIKYWLDDYRMQHDTDALIRQRIWYVFQRENISFAYPTRTVHVEPKPVEVTDDEQQNVIAERLNRVSIFAPLSDEEIERVANASTSRVYAPGEAIVHIGQEGNSMFVIIRGSVRVQLLEDGHMRTINTLKENSFFGEMSLLTGEPRSATVTAIDESEVLRIGKGGLKPILENNPKLVGSISELIEERRELLQRAIAEAEEDEAEESRKGMMRSIRGFFGIK
ncbi:MAG: mechanosensitive ion channel family protein [Pyrinomonadaceae bacterium]